jgi:hypothetical protein
MGRYQDTDGRDKRRDAKRKRELPQRAEVVVGSIEPQAIFHALDAVLSVGGALRIGRTRDGGAWAIGVYGDGSEPYTEYVQESEDINRYFHDLAGFFENTPK